MTAQGRGGGERKERDVVVEAKHDGERADIIVAAALGMSVREARTLFEARQVSHSGRQVRKGDRLRHGMVLRVWPPAPWLVEVAPVGLELVFHDEEFVVVHKPAGVPSHPLHRGEGGTAADGIAAWFPECSTASPDAREAGLVHRLDTNTSGLLAAARTRTQWTMLREAFAAEKVHRCYLALVEGSLSEAMVVDSPIAHDPRDARRMSVVDDGEAGRGSARAAKTTVTPVVSASAGSLVLVRIKGGRRHQVRTHLAHRGWPLVGDLLYGGRPCAAREGHVLHAVALSLPGRDRMIAAPPPDFELAMGERDVPHDALAQALGLLRASNFLSEPI